LRPATASKPEPPYGTQKDGPRHLPLVISGNPLVGGDSSLLWKKGANDAEQND